MSEYIIRGDESYSNIPIIDVGDPPDYATAYMVPISVEFGTQANKKRIWKSGQSYLDAYSYVDTGGYIHYELEWYPLPGWNSPSNPPYVSNIGNIDTLYIAACKTGDDALVGFVGDPANFPYYNQILFNGTYENLGPSITEVADWDESPTDNSEDTQNMLPRGGEFADTDPLGYGNDEIDVPDVINELSYSGFITAYKLDDGGVQNLGAAIFTSNTWTNLQNKFNGVGDPVSYIISAVEIPYAATADGWQDFNLGGIKVVDNNNIITAFQQFHTGTTIISRFHIWSIVITGSILDP